MRQYMDEDAKFKFLQSNYYDIVKRTLQKSASCRQDFVFEPAISLSELPNSEQEMHFKLVCSSVEPADVPLIKKRCDEKWDVELNNIPVYLRRPDVLLIARNEFMKKNYFQIVEEVVQERLNIINSIYKFQPRLPLSSLPDKQDRIVKQALCRT